MAAQAPRAEAPAAAAEGVSVRHLDSARQSLWDAFVTESPAATFFHLSAWRHLVETQFGHRTHYLYAARHGRIVGVLPIGHVKSFLFGNALISTPFCVYGGVVASDPEAERALVDAGIALGRDLGVDYLELRQRDLRNDAPRTQDLYVTFRKRIDEDPEANLGAIPRKQRAMVRKGMQAGLVGETDEGVDRFFTMYSESVRNLGTPVLPKKWFAALKETFAEACEVVTICDRGRPVSSVMSFYFRDVVLPYYGGGGFDARRLKANDFMYYHLMCRAALRGCRVFDYGRSKKGSGSYAFKKNWGFVPEDLHYEHHLIRATDPPALNPNNPKYKLAISAWKRLPIRLTRILGPVVAKYLA